MEYAISNLSSPDEKPNAQGDAFRRTRRECFLQRLNRLTEVDRQAFLSVYDALSKTRAVTPEIKTMTEPHAFSQKVYPLVQELTQLIGELAELRLRRNPDQHRTLHACLDDWNIAVNAWRNRICLSRSAFLYTHYCRLRRMAGQNLMN